MTQERRLACVDHGRDPIGFHRADAAVAVEQLARAEEPTEPPPMRRFPPPWE